MTSVTADQHNDYGPNLGRPGVTDNLAIPEQIPEFCGDAPANPTPLHQASSRLDNLASYPISRLARAGLDVAAEHIRSAGKAVRVEDEVPDAKRSPARHDLPARHLQQRVERDQQALRLVLRQAG